MKNKVLIVNFILVISIMVIMLPITSFAEIETNHKIEEITGIENLVPDKPMNNIRVEVEDKNPEETKKLFEKEFNEGGLHPDKLDDTQEKIYNKKLIIKVFISIMAISIVLLIIRNRKYSEYEEFDDISNSYYKDDYWD